MKLLALDTATEACSAALYIDGNICERYALSPREHTSLIVPMIDELMALAELKPAQLDAVAFGRGPGSFTGVRIATGIAQGIAFACDLPVVPVSNLATVAQDFFDNNPENTAFVAMDARMEEIYWAVYDRSPEGYATLTNQESVLPADTIAIPETAGVGIGTGWLSYAQALLPRLGNRVIRHETDNLPHARAVAKLGAQDFIHNLGVPAELARPVYLRNKVAKKEAERSKL